MMTTKMIRSGSRVSSQVVLRVVGNLSVCCCPVINAECGVRETRLAEQRHTNPIKD
jgi:hypothetical protein